MLFVHVFFREGFADGSEWPVDDGTVGEPQTTVWMPAAESSPSFCRGAGRNIFWKGFLSLVSLDLFFSGDFFTDSTMVNHHFSPPFGEYVFFPTTSSKSKHLVGLFSMGKETSGSPKLCLFSLAQKWGFKEGHLRFEILILAFVPGNSLCFFVEGIVK